MRTTKNMDYIYDDNGQPILIDLLQKDTREKVIAYFVQCRKEKKMTQADIARRTGIPRTNITRFESGRYNPSLEMLVKIAAALDMKLELVLKQLHSGEN
ncbi:MAG: helix-turn-helix transcriptional regulator [Eubacterium sp.]